MAAFILLVTYALHAIIATVFAWALPVPNEFKGLVWVLVMVFLNGMSFGMDWVQLGRSRAATPRIVGSMGRTLLVTGIVSLVFGSLRSGRGNATPSSGGRHRGNSGMPNSRGPK